MKNILIFLLLSLFLGYGCKYFKRSSSRKMDNIAADTGKSGAETVDSAAYYSGGGNEPVPTELPKKAATAKGNYYMIVGCFKVQQNADRYAEKLKTMGYEPLIIPGRENFQMVAARTYDSYKTSVAEIDKFRNEVSPQAWVYRKR